MKKIRIIGIVIVLSTLSLIQLHAKPTIYYLKFENDTPDRIEIFQKEGSPKVYWYMTYKITNDTNDDWRIMINIRAKTDSHKKYHDLSFPLAKESIEEKLGKKFNGIRDVSQTIIKAGETKECVAIFNAIDPEMDKLRIYIEGLTNDIKVEDIKGRPNKRRVTDKILKLVYKRPGDEFHAMLKTLEFVKKEWIKRVRIIKTDLDYRKLP